MYKLKQEIMWQQAAQSAVNEPTKYYSVEGTNLYFQVLKDGEPVDPMNFME